MTTDLQCTIIDENCEYSLRELCNLCKVHAQFIEELIDEGILSPQGQNPREWRFAAIEIKRIQVSIRLQTDLRINLPGTALVCQGIELFQMRFGTPELLDFIKQVECKSCTGKIYRHKRIDKQAGMTTFFVITHYLTYFRSSQ